MTHKDIYTKFMIEYDKANVTSSYPSLTEYEVATVLDKAYNALIAQKVTGNNVRRAPFEADIKAVSDLQQLVVGDKKDTNSISNTNILWANLPEDFLYFVSGNLIWKNVTTTLEEVESVDDAPRMEPVDTPNAYDGIGMREMPIKLVSHNIADKFVASSFNVPWIKVPVCYIENQNIYVVYDSFKTPEKTNKLSITYIKKPNLFVKDLSKYSSDVYSELSYFDYTLIPFEENIDTETPPYTETEEERTERRSIYNENVAAIQEDYRFECNDTVAEELISLAIAFALENVESQRLNTKLNMRGLEA